MQLFWLLRWVEGRVLAATATLPALIALILWPGNLAAQAAVAGVSGPADDVRALPYKLMPGGPVPISFTGYIQLRYTNQFGKPDLFQVKRLRFSADAELTPRLDVNAQIDARLAPTPLLDAYVQFKPLTSARFRLGQFKIPFSGESIIPDERTITVDRSIVVNGLSPGRDNGQQGRDLGVALLGNTGKKNGPSIEYEAAFLNGSGIYNVQTDRQRAGAGRLIVHPVKGASIGGDYYLGKELLAGSAANSSKLVVKERQDLEGGYKVGRFLSWGEYLWGHDGPIRRSGGYGLAAFKLNRHWEGWIRAQDFDANHAKRFSITRQYDAGLNYYFISLIRLQANYGAQKSPATGNLGHVFLAQLQAEF